MNSLRGVPPTLRNMGIPTGQEALSRFSPDRDVYASLDGDPGVAIRRMAQKRPRASRLSKRGYSRPMLSCVVSCSAVPVNCR